MKPDGVHAILLLDLEPKPYGVNTTLRFEVERTLNCHSEVGGVVCTLSGSRDGANKKPDGVHTTLRFDVDRNVT